MESIINQHSTLSLVLLVTFLSLAFLQELFFDVKAKFKEGRLKHVWFHTGISLLGMGAAYIGLFNGTDGTRIATALIVVLFMILFKLKKIKK